MNRSSKPCSAGERLAARSAARSVRRIDTALSRSRLKPASFSGQLIPANTRSSPAAGDLAKRLVVQGVEADVGVGGARRPAARLPAQPAAARWSSKRQIADTRHCGQQNELSSWYRRAAMSGSPPVKRILVHAQRHDDANEPRDFLVREQLVAWLEHDVFRRHAIETSADCSGRLTLIRKFVCKRPKPSRRGMGRRMQAEG